MASSATRRRVALRGGRPLFFARCVTQKMGYPDKGKALDAAEQLMERGACERGCHITPYPCSQCGEWHVFNRRIVIVPEER